VATPPDGWKPFGWHAGDDDPNLSIEFSQEKGEDGMPLWERCPICKPAPA
jgi:hypothetical protein